MATVNPRYAYARRKAGRLEVMQECSQRDADADAWTCSAAQRRPLKLTAARHKAGHERMLAAVAASSRGGRIVAEGSEAEKAQLLLSYLHEHGYVDLYREEHQ